MLVFLLLIIGRIVHYQVIAVGVESAMDDSLQAEASLVKQLAKVSNVLEKTRHEIHELRRENTESRREIKESRREIKESRDEVKRLQHENAESKRKINKLEADNKRHQLRIVRSKNEEERTGTKELEGRQDGMTSHLRQSKELGLPTFLDKLIDFVEGELYHSILYLNETVDAQRDAILERTNTEKLLKTDISDLKSEVNTVKSEVNAVKSNQLRCLSGYQKFKIEEKETEGPLLPGGPNVKGKTYIAKGRVTFNPAFSGTPDLCFAAFGPFMDTSVPYHVTDENRVNIDLSYAKVKSTHVDFKFYQPKAGFTIGVQWLACGHSNRGMKAEMLLDLKFNK